MSIINGIFSFNKKSIENTPPKVEESVIPTNNADPIKEENIINIYSHGFTNGVYRITPDADTFNKFLQLSSEQEKLELLQKQNDQKLLELKHALIVDTAVAQEIEEVIIDKGKLAETKSVQVMEIEQAKELQKDKITKLIEQRENTKAEYPWVPAFLYLLAGIIFIAGDITITHDITSWGFDIGGPEGWIFAIGLAFTAFLIKPFLDRVLEKVFQKTDFTLTGIYKIVLGTITALGITMLLFLGDFRSDSKIALSRSDALEEQMDQIQDKTSNEYQKLKKEYTLGNEDLNKNQSGKIGIMLSGVIFAIGGALCLAIAFPSLLQLIKRYQILKVHVRKANALYTRQDHHLYQLRNELAIISADRDKAIAKFKWIDLEPKKDTIRILEEEQRKLTELYYAIKAQKDISLYFDGKNRGEKYSIEGELIHKIEGKDPSDFQNKNIGAQASNSGKSKLYRSYTRRPFIKIRKMIADKHNNNSHNNSKDGTDFEIVS